MLHKESEEGKAQMQREGANKMGDYCDDFFEDHDIFFDINKMGESLVRFPNSLPQVGRGTWLVRASMIIVMTSFKIMMASLMIILIRMIMFMIILMIRRNM